MKPRPKKTPTTKPTKPTATPSLREQILADFATLRIPVTADQLDAALTDAEKNGRSHLEFLHRLLTDQAGLRRQRRIERLIKDAHFREAETAERLRLELQPVASHACRSKPWSQGDFIRRRRTWSSSANPAWAKAG